MYKAQGEIDLKMKDVDLFLEVRDAWLPISSKNTELEKILIKRNKLQNRLIIFNKFDLCNKQKTQEIIDNYNKIGIDCINVSVLKRLNLDQIIKFCSKKFPPKYDTSVGNKNKK